MRSHHLLLCIAALVSASAVQAQTYIGVQGTVSKPRGEMRDILEGKLGGGLGAHLNIGLSNGHAVMPRFDYIQYKREENGTGIKFQCMKAGLDHNYFVGGKANDGFYLSVGLGYVRVKVTDLAPVPEAESGESTGSVYYGAGVGFMFGRNLGLELKYDDAAYSLHFRDYSDRVSGPAVNLSAMIRF